jgi:hypothetical protein
MYFSEELTRLYLADVHDPVTRQALDGSAVEADDGCAPGALVGGVAPDTPLAALDAPDRCAAGREPCGGGRITAGENDTGVLLTRRRCRGMPNLVGPHVPLQALPGGVLLLQAYRVLLATNRSA